MHEFALYGQVAKDEQPRMLQQLAGVTRMQPQPVQEIHIVLKASPPGGLNNIPSAGGSQGVLSPDVQRIRGMLNASLYYLHLVGEVSNSTPMSTENSKENGDAVIANGDASGTGGKHIRWRLEFRDTPDAGKQAVSTRLVSKMAFDDGDLVSFFRSFGYEYVSRYMVVGNKFYDQDTTIFLHKVLQLPQNHAESAATDTSYLSDVDALTEFDGAGGYTFHASIDVVDGNNPDLKDKATRQLLSLKETMKQAINLTPGDRLALDTRLPAVSRRL